MFMELCSITIMEKTARNHFHLNIMSDKWIEMGLSENCHIQRETMRPTEQSHPLS